MIRRLNAIKDTKEPLKIVKELDAFPKIEPCYVETNARSGGVSIIMIFVVVALVFSEIRSYTQYEVIYEYGVDMDPSAAMKFYVDMTIASPCSLIGADILDATGKHAIDHDNQLEEIPTVFEMTSRQRANHEQKRITNKYLQQEYHSMHDTIWDMGFTSVDAGFPERDKDDKTPKNACRLRGTLVSRKLAGNFHITMGKPIQMFGGGHAHLTVFGGSTEDFNFSHIIHHFSVGEKAAGKVFPLDGDEHITQGSHIYQYFVKIVPTKINTKYANIDTFQYSVTEMDRLLNHSAGSHGTPGIFFKYDMSPIKVYVEQRYKPLWKFLVRLCGIIGGVYACTGIANALVDNVLDIICCRFKLGKYKPKTTSKSPMQTNSLITPLPDQSMQAASLGPKTVTTPYNNGAQPPYPTNFAQIS